MFYGIKTFIFTCIYMILFIFYVLHVKLNSEYKRNYVWHPNYKPVPQDVVTLPPQTLAKEMGIQRKKQYPSLAYRTSEVIGTNSALLSQDAVDLRTRSEERNGVISSKSGPRSRSAEPSVGRLHQKKIMVQSYPPLTSRCGALVPKIEEFPNIVEKAHKNTEYRSQFAWPSNTRGEVCTARKSVSMGLIKAPDQPDSSGATSKDRTDHGVPLHRSALKDMEMPSIAEKPTHKEKSAQDTKKKQSKTEYKAKYKPFTSYVYVEGQWKKTSRLVKICETQGAKVDPHPWYSEVMERLQKANAYKCRGHGHPVYGEQLPNIYMQQNETTPLVRPKKDHPEIHIPSIPIDGKKVESRKKERYEKKDKKTEENLEKKPEKEKKKSTRPKSAEPSKGRTSRFQQPRPQTAPPPIREKSAPTPAHHAYAKKTASKSRSPEMKQSSRAYSGRTSSRKPKEDSSRSMLPPDGRASRTSHHPPPQSGSGKVWLQAGASPGHHSPERESFKGKHSDAVRPSTLLPPPPKFPPKEEEELKESLPTELLKEKEAAIERKTSSPTPVPLTHVQTPEEVTGVKSPEPENWTVPLDKGQKLQWTESSSAEPLPQQGKISSPKIENVEKETDDTTSNLPSATEKESSPVAPQEPYNTTATSSSARMTTADVLDRARSRLDQFWGKNK